MNKLINITGHKFGRLQVLREFGRSNRQATWECICDCGTIKIYRGHDLRRNHTQSCGCLKEEVLRNNNVSKENIEKLIKRSTTHNFSRRGKHERIYDIFNSIKNRCTNSNSPDYKNYGGRGIKCLWQSFEEFRDDMYESYNSHVEKFGEKNTQIDRTDNNGSYYKENCRWATAREQANNRRNTLIITFNNQSLPLTEWATRLNLDYFTLRARLKVCKWSIEKALTHPKMVNQFR